MSRVKIWEPKTDSDRELVREELEAILDSSHFSSSKRYPAFLRFVVEKSLEGQADRLKERTLGIEVFGRQPDYDTNADPVVRVSAAEVRKRIALYYHEIAKESDLQIDLPTGSYVPEFRKKLTSAKPAVNRAPARLPESIGYPEQSLNLNVAQPREQTITATPRSSFRAFFHRPLLLTIGLLVALVSLVGYLVLGANSTRQMDQLWKPLLQTQGPVLIVTGSGSLELVAPEPPETTFYNHMLGPYHHVSVATAIAISRLAGVLEKHNKNYIVKEAPTTTLSDVRGRPVIFVCGLNNPWTLRLIEPLRFRLVPGPLARIEDTNNPQNTAWSVDFSKPYSSVSVDYGIVARYHDSYTNGDVMLIAGLGPNGTEAASEFVASSQYLKQIEKQVSAGPSAANLEMVVRTAIVNGEAGPPKLVAAYAF